MHQRAPRGGLSTLTFHVIDVLEGLRFLLDCSVDCVVMSSPYNKVNKARTGSDMHVRAQTCCDSGCSSAHIVMCCCVLHCAICDDLDEDKYQAQQIEVLNELHRVLKEDGTVWMHHKARRAGKEHMPTGFIQKSKLNLYGHVVCNFEAQRQPVCALPHSRARVPLSTHKDGAPSCVLQAASAHGVSIV